MPTPFAADVENPKTQEATRWCDDGWTAHILKNEDDDGWAVAMTKDGEREPALIGPWTMGRDKKNPKPLDGNAFRTLVKTASEYVLRHHQQLQASLHQSVTVMAKPPGGAEAQRITVKLDIATDDDAASAQLSAVDDAGEVLAQMRVAPDYKLTRTRAEAWVVGGFGATGR